MIFNLNSAFLCVITLLIVCCECHREGVKGGVKTFGGYRDSSRRRDSGEHNDSDDSDEHNQGGRNRDGDRNRISDRNRDSGRHHDNGEHEEGSRNQEGGRNHERERNHEGEHYEDCGHGNSHGNGKSSNHHNQRNQFNRQPSYGWNSFDRHPSRTYGGVIQSSEQSGFDRNYNQNNNQMGWDLQRWNQGSNPPQNIPPAAPAFNTNFNPGAFFTPFGSAAPFPAYPGFTGFPQPLPGYQGHNQDRFNPANQFGGGMTPPDRRVGTNGFSTNSFFFNPGMNIGNSFGNREWNRDDEMKWQATTKKPYFENKQPGRECALPAAAVLGAASAFGVSSLLPLMVPIGKPILSCNATDLQQTQIKLSGNVYDCNRRAITMSCPKTDEFDNTSDDCQGETLECDVRMRPTDEARVSCTNGTLISNHLIVCKSATLMENKNILNCFYKKELSGGSSSEEDIRVTPLYLRPSTARPLSPRPAYQTTSTSRPAYQTISTSRPAYETNTISTSRTTSARPLYQSNSNEENELEDNGEHLFGVGGIDSRVTDNKVETNQQNVGITTELDRAMQNVFPSDLLVTRKKMYLPPKESMPSMHFSPELKDLVNSVFPSGLLASSTKNEKPLSNSGMSTDLRNAMENVFPSDLLAVPNRPVQMVTPRSTQMPSNFSPELQQEMNGTFPSDLLASSTRIKETANESETQSEFQNINEESRGQQSTTDNENQNTHLNAFRGTTRHTQVSDVTRTQQSTHFDSRMVTQTNEDSQINRNRWNINPNSKSSVNSNGVKTFKVPTNVTPDQQSLLSTRFSSDSYQEQPDDRLIFSNK